MSDALVAVIAFVCTFGGALLGILLHTRLPDHHRDADSKDVVKLVMGLIATISALVLGLLISSARSAYDAQDTEVQQLGMHLVQLDRVLTTLGPKGSEPRELLRKLVAADLARTWPADGARGSDVPTAETKWHAEMLFDQVANLTPTTGAERFSQSRALQLLTTMGETRRLLLEQAHGSLSWPFFVVLVFWLSVLFIGFGLFARFNVTVVVALFLGAISVAGAIFLILEMDRPYSGLMQVSSLPIRSALAVIGR